MTPEQETALAFCREVMGLFMGRDRDQVKRDKLYREWIQRQRSCISDSYSEYLENGEGRCIAAHVRRASHSGTGYKPLFSCVPLTDAEHRYIHQHGEESLRPKWWWDEQVRVYLDRWEQLQ